jgi:hypothetical protein
MVSGSEIIAVYQVVGLARLKPYSVYSGTFYMYMYGPWQLASDAICVQAVKGNTILTVPARSLRHLVSSSTAWEGE